MLGIDPEVAGSPVLIAGAEVAAFIKGLGLMAG